MSRARAIARNIAKNKYAYLKDKEKMSLVLQKAEIFRNGITEVDLEKEFGKGYQAGWNDCSECVLKTTYAAVCSVLGEFYGDDEHADEIIDFIQQVDRKVIVTIADEEAVQDVFDKYGVLLNFKNEFERVEVK